jgi:SAM-dependent methyltransferase
MVEAMRMKTNRMTSDMKATRNVIELITGGWRAQAVYTAVKLGLPDHIKAGLTTSAELAAATGAKQEGVHRLLRLLVALDVFEGGESVGYRNTPVSAMLLEGPQSMRDMVLLHGEEYYTAWGEAHHAITTVSSGFEAAHDTNFYAYLGQHSGTAQRFQHALNAGNMFFHAVPDAYDFAGKRVVDVGGGGGDLLAAILGAVPDARGVLFDREHMIPEARRHLAAAVGLDRVEFAAGDMFEAVPEGGDVYILCRVLAGWEDDAVVKLFESCRRALADSSSRLLVIDRFVVEEGSSVLPALWDLHLLMITGGRHRSRDHLTALLHRAGLDVERVAELPMENAALIAAPRAGAGLLE